MKSQSSLHYAEIPEAMAAAGWLKRSRRYLFSQQNLGFPTFGSYLSVLVISLESTETFLHNLMESRPTYAGARTITKESENFIVIHVKKEEWDKACTGDRAAMMAHEIGEGYLRYGRYSLYSAHELASFFDRDYRREHKVGLRVDDWSRAEIHRARVLEDVLEQTIGGMEPFGLDSLLSHFLI